MAIYCISYMFLSFHGHYYGHARGDLHLVKKDGTQGFSMYDTILWLPQSLDWRHMILSNGEEHRFWNIGGLLYSPLISLDRKIWHKSVDLIEEDKKKT